jgi:4-aminobutyrate aminotransferase
MSLELLSNVWPHMTHIQPVKAEGIYIYNQSGKRYTDFTSGIGVTNTGHCHPKVVKAIQEQASKLLFGQVGIVLAPGLLELAAKLDEITPKEIDSFFFTNSGAEATEAAVKLSRQATGRTNIIVMQGSFHGRTGQAMAMTTAKTTYRHKYQPLPSGVFVTPFPYSYFYGWDEDTTVEFCIRQLHHLLKSQTAPDETAAIMIEPILGEGGYVPAPKAYLEELRHVCDKYGIMLVIDEVQTGFGRTGKLFCFEHSNLLPDIMVMAKGLGSGLPISGVGARREMMNKWAPGTHGGTYGGGSAIPLAAAKATIEVLLEENLPAQAGIMGERLMNGLIALQQKFPVIGEVRGRGLMIGTEFTDAAGQADKDTCKAVQKACLEQDLLLLTCGTYENIIRWIPPLVVNAEQIDEALGVFRKALEKTVKTAVAAD